MPDVRLIDANALMKRICGHECGMHPEDCDGMESETVPCNFYAYVNEAPTIDAHPIIHAHWIMLDKQVGQCSNCGYCQKSNGIDKTGHGNIHNLVYKWCTACGAKMTEVMRMKLHNERLQWIYDNIEDFKRALVTVDFCKQHRVSGYDDRTFNEADDIVHSLALSFLMVAMGENIPKEMWTVDDFSELYTVLDDNRDDLNLRDYG